MAQFNKLSNILNLFVKKFVVFGRKLIMKNDKEKKKKKIKKKSFKK